MYEFPPFIDPKCLVVVVAKVSITLDARYNRYFGKLWLHLANKDSLSKLPLKKISTRRRIIHVFCTKNEVRSSFSYIRTRGPARQRSRILHEIA